VSEGGLAVALAEMAIGGGLGIAAELPGTDATLALFAESTGRIVVEVEPEHEADLLARLGADARRIGTVTSDRAIRLTVGDRVVVDVGLDTARAVFSGETR
jgi:phosphoribosylformylglycinamidine synthase